MSTSPALTQRRTFSDYTALGRLTTGEIDDGFTAIPDALWADVLARQPGRVAWMASAPSDLSLN